MHTFTLNRYSGFPRFPENSDASWLFQKKFQDLEKCWKMGLVLESPGIYLWFKLTNVHSAEFGLLLTETIKWRTGKLLISGWTASCWNWKTGEQPSSLPCIQSTIIVQINERSIRAKLLTQQFLFNVWWTPSSPTDNIGAMMIVWKVRGEIIWPALCCCAS